MSKVVVVISLLLWILTAGALGALNESLVNGATSYVIYHFGEDSSVSANKTEEAAGRTFNAWSILWYVGSFVGLVAFFFIISFSEWCCKRRLWQRRNNNSNAAVTSSTTQNSSADPAPPAYDLFAPPSYDSIYKDGTDEKPQFEVYVVPLNSREEIGIPFCNTLVSENACTNEPPSYSSTATTVVNTESSSETNTNNPSENDSSVASSEINKKFQGRRGKYRAPQPSSSSASVTVPIENSRDDGGGKDSISIQHNI